MARKVRGKGRFSIIEWLRSRFRRRPKARKRQTRPERKRVNVKSVKRAERPSNPKPPKEGSGFLFRNKNGKEIFLETSVDRLLQEVGKRGRVKASVLAGIFKVPRSKIEEWGIILEEHKLIDMHYPPFGEPTLMLKKPEVKKGRKKK